MPNRSQSSKIWYVDNPYKMYVEQNISEENLPPLVFIHGSYHTGVCYTQTPDGRLGWAPLFCEKGYETYVTDMPGVGRSGDIDFERINGKFIVEAYIQLLRQIPKKVVLITHSVSGCYGLKIGELIPEKIAGIVSIEPSLPGEIEDPVIPYYESDSFVKAKLKGIDFVLDLENYHRPSEQFIRSLTQGSTTQFPIDAYSLAQYRASLQKISPRLVYERLNIHGSQMRIEDYKRLSSVKCMVLTSPKNPLHIKDDKKIPETLRPYGVHVNHYKLDEVGIEGNGHMMMIEKNNMEIMTFIDNWIRENIRF